MVRDETGFLETKASTDAEVPRVVSRGSGGREGEIAARRSRTSAIRRRSLADLTAGLDEVGQILGSARAGVREIRSRGR